MLSRTLVVSLLLLMAGRGQAQEVSRRDWRVSSDMRKAVVLPRQVPDTALRPEFPDGAALVGLTIDLNGDGRPDFIVRLAHDGCGATGNCEFALVDGGRFRKIGMLEGNTIFVLAQRVGGWPVLQTWWHSSAGSGLFSTYVFDGKSYTVVSAVHVEGKDVGMLFAELDKIRRGPPTH